jgi:hypothetical protein
LKFIFQDPFKWLTPILFPKVDQFFKKAIWTEVQTGLAVKSDENINKAMLIFSTIKFV